MKQLELFSSSYLEPTKPVVSKSWVGPYAVRRLGKTHTYYRFYWLQNGDQKCVHIPGGNHVNHLVLSRKKLIESWIAEGLSPIDIAARISEWSEGRGSNWHDERAELPVSAFREP